MDDKVDLKEKTTKNTHNIVADLLYEACPDKGRVLDVPCGEGAFIQRITPRGYQVTGCDVVDAKLPGADFINCDITEPLPFADATFNAVVSIDGIEHIRRPYDFTAESGRILKPGGVLIVSTPNISAIRSRWRWFLTGFHNKGKKPLNEVEPSPRHHIRLFSFSDMRYMLHSNGFRIDAIRHNRIKPVSWFYLPLVPLCALATKLVFMKEEKRPDQVERNREIFSQMYSLSILFGETMIIRARRVED